MGLTVVRIATTIHLNEQQKRELNSIVQSRALPAGYMFGAKVILLLNEGATFTVMRERLGTTTATIIRWKERLLAAGVDWLDTNHPGQKAYRLTPIMQAKILGATRKPPTDGSTHWSCRGKRRVISSHLAEKRASR